MSNQTIKISEILQKDSAVLPNDGTLIFDRIVSNIQSSGNPVFISFEGLKYITTGFINASIGQFLMMYPDMKSSLIFDESMEDDLKFRIDRSINLALNPVMRKAHDEAIEEMICE